MFKVIGLGNREPDNGPRCLKPPIGNKQRVNLYDDSWSWVLRQSTQWHWQRVNVRGYNQLSQDNVGVWMFGGEVHRKVSVTSHCLGMCTGRYVRPAPPRGDSIQFLVRARQDLLGGPAPLVNLLRHFLIGFDDSWCTSHFTYRKARQVYIVYNISSDFYLAFYNSERGGAFLWEFRKLRDFRPAPPFRPWPLILSNWGWFLTKLRDFRPPPPPKVYPPPPTTVE